MTKKLDDELANAAGLDETEDAAKAPGQNVSAGHAAPAEAEGPSSTPGLVAAAPHYERAGRSVGLLVMLLVMVGAVVALFLVGFKDAAVYSTPIDQLDKATAGRKVRLEGELVPGTLVKRDQPCEYRFKIHGEKTELPVHYAQCVIPDTFRDIKEGGVQVTVEGSLDQSGEFQASLIMAKCTSKYNPDTHEMKDGKKGISSMESTPIN